MKKLQDAGMEYTVHIINTDDGWQYDVYEGSPDEIANAEDARDNNARQVDGGCCTTTLENTMGMVADTLSAHKRREDIEETEMCPHCDEELEARIFDIDGTNLEEHEVCPKCEYGSPALR